MLSSDEIKRIIAREREYLESIVDPVERKCCGSFIAGLECVLNE